MTQDIQAFTVNIPPGGTAAAPQSFDMKMPPREVIGVEIVIPDGVRGTVGFGLGMANTIIIPSNAAAYIFGNDEVIRWPLSGYPNSGAWKLFAYNLGNYYHTLYVRFLLKLINSASATTPRQFIDNSQLISG